MTDTFLKGRLALVSGASRGIGQAMALELAKAGAHVIATARTQGGLEELDDAIKAAGGTATLVPMDLMSEDGIGASWTSSWPAPAPWVSSPRPPRSRPRPGRMWSAST